MNIGFLGGGQLAKMSSMQALRLGINVHLLEEDPESPALSTTPNNFIANWNNRTALKKLRGKTDVVTLENEFISTQVISFLEELGAQVVPSSHAVSCVQDKYIQKQNLRKLSIPVPDFAKIVSEQDVILFSKKHGYPFLLKSRLKSYDGYGNRTINKESELKQKMKELGFPQNTLYAESFIKFEKEIAITIARNKKGETSIFPLVETIQENHKCKIVKAPLQLHEISMKLVNDFADLIMCNLLKQGIVTVEMFLMPSGEIVVNEIAPRPHNSAHYTIDACNFSQFDAHVYSTMNLPMKPVNMVYKSAVMINLLGKGNFDIRSCHDALKDPSAFVHIYGKKESKPGRKMGHLTVVGSDINQCMEKAIKLESGIDI